MKKWKLIVSWILRILVALGFLLASLGKLTSNANVIQMFENWGFPDGFYLVIGILELVLAVMLLIPKTMKIALLGLIVLMVGAIITHIVNDPIGQILRPIIFMLFLLGIYFLNFRKVKTIQT